LAIGLRHPIGPKSNQNWDTQINDPLFVWNHRQDKSPRSLKGHKLGVNRVQFTDKGKTLVSASHDWTIRVWDVE
jgi:WD40 repeat protein